jgi:hypothetical protein
LLEDFYGLILQPWFSDSNKDQKRKDQENKDQEKKDQEKEEQEEEPPRKRSCVKNLLETMISNGDDWANMGENTVIVIVMRRLVFYRCDRRFTTTGFTYTFDILR